MTVNDHDVLIVGAGATGLMLAGELALAGVDVAIIERRPDQTVTGMRARGLHARTLEILDQRGIVDRFLAEGYTAQVAGFAGVMFDLAGFPTRHPYGLALEQQAIERILAGWVDALGVPIHRGSELSGFTQDENDVAVTLADGRSLRAAWLVGCDGGRSRVRKAAGIGFPGWDASTSALLAQVSLTEEPPWGLRRDEIGQHGLSKLEDGRAGVMVTEREIGGWDEPSLADLSAAMVAAFGSDFGAHDPSSLSRFTDATRQAESYRRGRVLLAGDAAHIHAPDGGHGLQLGIHDAVNLGWKLAQVVRGVSPQDLLDTYEAERHPVTARTMRHTMSAVALRRPDARIEAVRETVADLLACEEPRNRMAASMSGLDIRYDFGEGHPLLGRRMPDLNIMASGDAHRVFDLLRDGRHLLLRFTDDGETATSPWTERVRAIVAVCDDTWSLPAIGLVSAPTAVLVRPDGHVAWVGQGCEAGLGKALERWCGMPENA